MDKAELKSLLETPLDPNLDYSDATASIEAIANHIRDLHKLINYLFESVAIQGASVISLRKKSIEFEADLLAADIPTTNREKGSAIIMPKHDKIRSN